MRADPRLTALICIKTHPTKPVAGGRGGAYEAADDWQTKLSSDIKARADQHGIDRLKDREE